MSSIPARGKHTTPFAFGVQPRLTHQSGHPFAGDASPIAQLGMQTWAAVSTTMSVKLLPNLFCELGIFSFALTGGTLAPGVKATFLVTKPGTSRQSELLPYVVRQRSRSSSSAAS